MATVQEIDRLIAQRESAIKAAQGELDALKKVRDMLANGNGNNDGQLALPSITDKALPREGSAVRYALDLLREKGHPIRLSAIYEALTAAGIKITKESFFSGLYRAKNEGRWFTLTGPSEFGLQEWGN